MGELVELATWRERRQRNESAPRVDDVCSIAVAHGSSVRITSSTFPMVEVAVASYEPEQMKLDPTTPEIPKP